jgi:hypothetical protein
MRPMPLTGDEIELRAASVRRLRRWTLNGLQARTARDTARDPTDWREGPRERSHVSETAPDATAWTRCVDWLDRHWLGLAIVVAAGTAIISWGLGR